MTAKRQIWQFSIYKTWTEFTITVIRHRQGRGYINRIYHNPTRATLARLEKFKPDCEPIRRQHGRTQSREYRNGDKYPIYFISEEAGTEKRWEIYLFPHD